MKYEKTYETFKPFREKMIIMHFLRTKLHGYNKNKERHGNKWKLKL